MNGTFTYFSLAVPPVSLAVLWLKAVGVRPSSFPKLDFSFLINLISHIQETFLS